jgi:hypothetical protein
MKIKTLQELHLEAIENSYHTVYRNMNEEEEVNNEEAASKSAEITEQIAIEFALWIADTKKHGYSKQLYEAMIVNKVSTPKELFQEFLKTRV